MAYSSGYWQLIDVKPKIATEDYSCESIHWKKGDLLGEWVILKKVFTAKMKPRIDFTYEDSRWLKFVSSEVIAEIEKYFDEHPEFKQKFDDAKVKLPETVTNCWFNLPEEKEYEFRSILEKLPQTYTMDAFWEVAKDYTQYISKPPTTYLLNFSTYPWEMDEEFNSIYHAWDLIKN